MLVDPKIHALFTQLGILMIAVLSMVWSDRFARFLVPRWLPTIRKDSLVLSDMALTMERSSLQTAGLTTTLGGILTLVGRAMATHGLWQQVVIWVLMIFYSLATVYVGWILPSATHAEFTAARRWGYRTIAWAVVIAVNASQFAVILLL